MDCFFKVGGLYRWKGMPDAYKQGYGYHNNFFHLYPRGPDDGCIETSSYQAVPGTCLLFLTLILDGPNLIATCLVPDGTIHEASFSSRGPYFWEEVTEQEEMEKQ